MFLGYSVLNCKISNTEETFSKDAYIIVESKEITSFNLSRYGFVNHIEEGIYFFPLERQRFNLNMAIKTFYKLSFFDFPRRKMIRYNYQAEKKYL